MSLPWPTSLAQVPSPMGLRSLLGRMLDRPWVSALELLLIGSVVYIALRFLQGTRGTRLVRAVLTILGVSFAAVWLIAVQFESERIKVLYPYFVLSVFLVSLVAFQSELRRMLLKVGEGGWLQRWMRGTELSLDPVFRACERLAARRIGALVAIERSAELDAVIESGVQLDARVSEDLVETIFWPGTPLHDLGVVIRQDRIVAAGCQFPLSEAELDDRSLGSRHRAAVGMSEETDAVVIVVSEETGRVSVASGGRLYRSISGATLREIVGRELRSTLEEKVEPTKESPAPEDQDAAREAAEAQS